MAHTCWLHTDAMHSLLSLRSILADQCWQNERVHGVINGGDVGEISTYHFNILSTMWIFGNIDLDVWSWRCLLIDKHITTNDSSRVWFSKPFNRSQKLSMTWSAKQVVRLKGDQLIKSNGCGKINLVKWRSLSAMNADLIIKKNHNGLLGPGGKWMDSAPQQNYHEFTAALGPLMLMQNWFQKWASGWLNYFYCGNISIITVCCHVPDPGAER